SPSWYYIFHITCTLDIGGSTMMASRTAFGRKLKSNRRWSFPRARPRLELLEDRTLLTTAFTTGFGHDAQHTGLSTVASQSLASVHWSTPVDLNPQIVSGDLLIHYGEPVFTTANTVVIPVKTGATNGFKVEALNGANGAVKWTIPDTSINYVLPSHNWT